MNAIPFKYVIRVFRYLKPHWRLAAASIVVTMLSAAAALLTPWTLKIVVDHVLERQPLPPILARALGTVGTDRISLLVIAVCGGLAVTLLLNSLHVVSNYINTRIDQFITLDFRSQMFLHAQRLSLAYHERRRSGMLIYMINSQGDAPAALIMTVPMLMESALTLVGMLWISFAMDPWIALASLAVVPFLYYSVGYYASHIQNRLQRVLSLEGESLSVIHESLSIMRVIVAFGREEHEFKRFRTQTTHAVTERVKITVRQTVFSLVVNMITAIGTSVVLGIGAYQVIQGRLTVGQMLVVIAYIAAVYKPLEAISFTIGSLQDRFISLKNTFELLDTVPDIRDEPGAQAMQRAKGHLQWEGVKFAYPGRTNTLSDISFEVKPGQVVGIVGQTGAGKSTLVSLLPRFYDITGGRILLDGVDIRKILLRSLRDQVSVVLQEPLLFSGTIAENIRYGRLDATDAEIVEAAKCANAHDFIMNLPQKYQTMLGERGAAVSGGERQRISIARAFLKDAPILILDEPTSSVDSKTEAVILDALDRLMAGRTTFMIAHRLSTLNNADIILVLQQGQLVEKGTQAELLALGKHYKQLYDAQVGLAREKATPTVEQSTAIA